MNRNPICSHAHEDVTLHFVFASEFWAVYARTLSFCRAQTMILLVASIGPQAFYPKSQINSRAAKTSTRRKLLLAHL